MCKFIRILCKSAVYHEMIENILDIHLVEFSWFYKKSVVEIRA